MDSIGDYKIHPAANLFPMMDEASLAELVEDIRKHGLESPITEWQGQILDGRNRLLACERAGVEPTVSMIEDEKLDPVAYVLSLNLHRRHLNTSQRSMIAARIEEMFRPAAKERMKEGQKSGGRGKKKNSSSNLNESLETPSNGRADVQAAKALSVSQGSVTNAKTVLQHGSPELIAAVERGEVSVSKAAKSLAPAKPVRKLTGWRLCDEVRMAIEKVRGKYPEHLHAILPEQLRNIADEFEIYESLKTERPPE